MHILTGCPWNHFGCQSLKERFLETPCKSIHHQSRFFLLGQIMTQYFPMVMKQGNRPKPYQIILTYKCVFSISLRLYFPMFIMFWDRDTNLGWFPTDPKIFFYHRALDVFCCIVVLDILVGENLDVREDKKETSLRFSRFVASPPCVSGAGINLRGSV